MHSVQNTTFSVINTEPRGQHVTVTDAFGRSLDRVVWDIVGDTVYVCSPRCFQWLLDGETQINPVGFDRSKVVGL